MEVSSQLHIPATLPPIPIGQKARRAPGPVGVSKIEHKKGSDIHIDSAYTYIA